MAVKEFLDQHLSAKGLVFHPGAILLYGFVIGIGAIAIGSFMKTPIGQTASLFGGLIFFMIMSALSSAMSGRLGEVSVRPKSEATSFFKRKKDDLIVQFLIAIIAGTLGVIGTLVTQHVTKNKALLPRLARFCTFSIKQS